MVHSVLYFFLFSLSIGAKSPDWTKTKKVVKAWQYQLKKTLNKGKVTGAGKQPGLSEAEGIMHEMAKGHLENETFQVRYSLYFAFFMN